MMDGGKLKLLVKVNVLDWFQATIYRSVDMSAMLCKCVSAHMALDGSSPYAVQRFCDGITSSPFRLTREKVDRWIFNIVHILK